MMSPYSDQDLPGDEKHIHAHSNQCQSSACQCGSNSSTHNPCHNARLRRLLVPVVFSLLTIAAVLLVSCLYDVDVFGLGADTLDLANRATGNTTTNNGSFVKHKRTRDFD